MTFNEKNYSTENRKIKILNKKGTLRCYVTVAIECLTIAILVISYLSVDNFSKPYIAFFTCDQSDILEPYKPNSVSTESMIVFGNLIPISLFIWIEFSNASTLSRIFAFFKDKGHKINGRGMREHVIHAINLFFLGQFTTVLITETSKRWVGRLRPHFMDACKPKLENIICYNKTLVGQIYNSIYTGGDFCTGDPKVINEARLSFPSGHASFTTYCAIYLIIYLEARFFVTRFDFAKRLIQIVTFVLCMIVCLSRIIDSQHRASDVAAGFILGTLVAGFTAYVGRNVWSFTNDDNGYIDMKSVSDNSIKQENDPMI